MRFYKKQQADMLWSVSMMLKNERDNLIKRVPALREVIDEFLEKQELLYSAIVLPINEVSLNTLQKKSVRDAFEDVVMKIISALMAADFRNKNKKTEVKYCTRSGLKKLTAANLCKEFLKVSGAVKKIKNSEFYGLSDEYMRDAHAYYKEFKGIKGAPILKRKERVVRNKKIDGAIKECIEMLERSIDPLMRIATEGESELTAKYKSVRMVMTKGQGRPSDAETAYRKSRKPKPTNTQA